MTPVIDSIDINVVANPDARYAISALYGDVQVTDTVVRIRCDDGVGIAGAISWTEGAVDLALAHATSHVAEALIGANPLERERLHDTMAARCASMLPLSLAPLDIALWDYAGRQAGEPLHRLLGSARSSIPAYASTPFLPSIDAFVEAVEGYLESGFRAVKFHPWCIPDRDVELIEEITRRFGDRDVAWMLDPDARYSRSEALRVGRELDQAGWFLYEAPIPDTDLDGYRDLRRKLDIEIICGGNTILDLRLLELGARMGAWDHLRVDAALAGGITGAQRAFALARAHSMNLELQSWGTTLVQAANLHLMLANPNCFFYEMAIPSEPMEYLARNPIRLAPDGTVTTSDLPGLGVDLDWDAVEEQSLLHIVIDRTGWREIRRR